MPIVFVHGVNNRAGPSYDAGVAVTKAFLKQHFQGAKIGAKSFGQVPDPLFPYWGDLATSFAWNMASLPSGEMQSLGGGGDTDLRPILATVKDAVGGDMTDEPLMALAKRDFTQAVEVVCTLALQETTKGMEADIAEFVVSAQTYAAANPNPPWVANITQDDQLIGNLHLAIKQGGGVQSQGIGSVINAIKKAGSKLKNAAKGLAGKAADKVGDFASSKLVGWTRDGLNETLGRFFGDVFIYFNSRGKKDAPGPIPQLVIDKYEEALTGAPANEPFVVIGHSLGGVISFDVLSHYLPDLEVDLFISVGSQVAHFEELKLYKVSDKAIVPPAKAPKPANIKRWINVYDEVDIFSYACDRVFKDVDIDARYDTETYVIKAHGEYFKQRRFYERLRARVDELP